jgi:hypothetical protein
MLASAMLWAALIWFLGLTLDRMLGVHSLYRAIRQQLGWSMRKVHAASVALAKQRRKPAFVIPPSRLHGKNKIPSIHRLYALALIYRRTVNELLSLYGIPL